MTVEMLVLPSRIKCDWEMTATGQQGDVRSERSLARAPFVRFRPRLVGADTAARPAECSVCLSGAGPHNLVQQARLVIPPSVMSESLHLRLGDYKPSRSRRSVTW